MLLLGDELAGDIDEEAAACRSSTTLAARSTTVMARPMAMVAGPIWFSLTAGLPHHKETSIDRTRRFFYVTCSRAEERFAVVYYTDSPDLTRDAMVRQGWFQRTGRSFTTYTCRQRSSRLTETLERAAGRHRNTFPFGRFLCLSQVLSCSAVYA